jgi:hypothetical protein
MTKPKPMPSPSPIYSITEKFVNDEYKRLENAQITPWAFFNSNGIRVNDFYGKPIAIRGVKFSGSVELVFWSRYIEPFLEDISFKAIDMAIEKAAEREIPLVRALPEVQGQLHGLCRRVYDRMASIDQRLRGGGFPEKVQLRGTAGEVARMRQFIDKRIDGELWATKASAAPKKWGRANQWFKDHPLVPWLIGLPFLILGACKALGLI